MACQHYYRVRTIYGEPLKVPCGSCILCRKAKRTFLAHRILHDVQSCYPVGSSFITLTIESDRFATTLDKSLIQKFNKLLRSKGYRYKFVAIGDYGSRTQRAHYHMLGIGLPIEAAYDIKHCWPHGFVSVDPINSARVNYVLNYMDSFRIQDKDLFRSRGIEPPFRLMSKNIGSSLFRKYPYSRYYFRGRWFDYPHYWRSVNGSSKPCKSIDEMKRNIYTANRKGFRNAVEMRNFNSFLSETISLHDDVNKCRPPQGIKHLPNSEPIF